MPLDWKNEIGNDKVEQRTWLEMPVIGMESEFNVWLDDVEINPEEYWKHPSAFIDGPLLVRTEKSSQLPTGGAVYFDRGVIEVVTPVIELAPSSTARMVRSLWDQITFVRNELSNWEKRAQHTVRLKGYSSHYNVSYEIPRAQQTPARNVKTLALLLAYILPVPVMVTGGNRRSTGVGVRPRGNRIEVTVDFTPDPGLTIATATLIVGIVREVMSWPSYDLAQLRTLPIPVIDGVIPGKHTTRKGWLTKDFHYPQSPYTCDISRRLWKTQHGETLSLRQIAARTAWFFRRSIRSFADPFSFRLLFAIMNGKAPSLLELVDRPGAYEDVGHLCKWGAVIHELKSYTVELDLLKPRREASWTGSIDDYVRGRASARQKHAAEMASVSAVERAPAPDDSKHSQHAHAIARSTRSRRPAQSRRRNDRAGTLIPKRPSRYLDRRGTELLPPQVKPAERRRKIERRTNNFATPFPDRRLTRSAYEQVFLKLVSGGSLKLGRDVYKPVGMKGWYHAVFRRQSDGRETLMTIDQLLRNMNDWK